MRRAATSIEAATRLTARERCLAGRAPMDVDTQLLALRDASAVLEALGVPHALIGGLAVGVRSGVPRATDDIDLAVVSAAVVDQVIAAMTAAGFVHRGSFEHSVNFRHNTGEPVQLAFDVRFDDLISRAEHEPVMDRTVLVVTRADLITMKQWAATAPGRRRSKALRDMADIELLRGDVGDADEGW